MVVLDPLCSRWSDNVYPEIPCDWDWQGQRCGLMCFPFSFCLQRGDNKLRLLYAGYLLSVLEVSDRITEILFVVFGVSIRIICWRTYSPQNAKKKTKNVKDRREGGCKVSSMNALRIVRLEKRVYLAPLSHAIPSRSINQEKSQELCRCMMLSNTHPSMTTGIFCENTWEMEFRCYWATYIAFS